jgi:hypothetical protein
MRNLLVSRVRETPQDYHTNTSASDIGTPLDEQTIDLKPEEDLISLNALGYALRVDPTRVRRWVENETLRPDMSQTSGERTRYTLLFYIQTCKPRIFKVHSQSA